MRARCKAQTARPGGPEQKRRLVPMTRAPGVCLCSHYRSCYTVRSLLSSRIAQHSPRKGKIIASGYVQRLCSSDQAIGKDNADLGNRGLGLASAIPIC